MLTLTKPANQDRLNAAVAEVADLNVMGPVCIPGEWDAHEAMLYTEVKLKQPHTLYFITEDDGSIMYQITNKLIHFKRSCVYIYPNNDVC